MEVLPFSEAYQLSASHQYKTTIWSPTTSPVHLMRDMAKFFRHSSEHHTQAVSFLYKLVDFWPSSSHLNDPSRQISINCLIYGEDSTVVNFSTIASEIKDGE
jgi:hypothetical protein